MQFKEQIPSELRGKLYYYKIILYNFIIALSFRILNQIKSYKYI